MAIGSLTLESGGAAAAAVAAAAAALPALPRPARLLGNAADEGICPTCL